MFELDAVPRRKEPRYPASFTVRAIGDVTVEGQAKDLSTLGCAIETDRPAAPHSYLRLELCLPDDDPPLEIQLAVVRWNQDRLFGVEFIAFGELQRTRLRRFLGSMSGPAPQPEGTQEAA